MNMSGKKIFSQKIIGLTRFSRCFALTQKGEGELRLLGALIFVSLLCAVVFFGYQRIMAFYKLKTTIKQINTIVNNMRTTYLAQSGEKQLSSVVNNVQRSFSSQGKGPYSEFETGKGLSAGMQTAIAMDIFPSKMFVKETETSDPVIKNVYGGDVYIISEDGGASFSVIFEGLPKEAAVGLGTEDWTSKGLNGLQEILLSDSAYEE